MSMPCNKCGRETYREDRYECVCEDDKPEMVCQGGSTCYCANNPKSSRQETHDKLFIEMTETFRRYKAHHVALDCWCADIEKPFTPPCFYCEVEAILTEIDAAEEVGGGMMSHGIPWHISSTRLAWKKARQEIFNDHGDYVCEAITLPVAERIVQALNRDELFEKMVTAIRIAQEREHDFQCHRYTVIGESPTFICTIQCKEYKTLLAKIDAENEEAK